jgi:hypothetical protein
LIEENDKVARLLRSNIGGLTSFQQYIKNKLFSNSGKAKKLINLGKEIGKINFDFRTGKDTKTLALQVSKIILVLKFFASAKDKERIDGDNGLMSRVGVNEDKKKLVDKMKTMSDDNYTLTEDDKNYLKEILDENVIDNFLSKM